MSPLLRTLPNMLTGSRLFFAAGYLLLLALADVSQLRPEAADVSRLNWAFILFVTAGVTDILDGPLARRLKVTSSFGRRFDPLMDKVLVGGGFILLAWKGKDFTYIAWWMTTVILAREAFVTIVRHWSEAQGRKFAATWAGKLKMFLQSFTIGTVIMYLAHFQQDTWAVIMRNICVWTTVVFTALSALIYLPRMKHLRFKK